jgi:anti-anti-sigma factor
MPIDRPPAALGGGHAAGDGQDEFTDRVVRITRTRRPHGLSLEGELDQANVGTLAAALAAVVDTSQDIHLDLSRLEFIDVGGLRLLTETAKRLPAGQHLVLEGVAPYLRKILALVGWERTPGLRIGSGRER